MNAIKNPYSYEFFELGVRREALNYCKKCKDPNKKSNYFIDKYIECVRDYYENLIPNNCDAIEEGGYVTPKVIKYCCQDCAAILVLQME